MKPVRLPNIASFHKYLLSALSMLGRLAQPHRLVKKTCHHLWEGWGAWLKPIWENTQDKGRYTKSSTFVHGGCLKKLWEWIAIDSWAERWRIMPSETRHAYFPHIMHIVVICELPFKIHKEQLALANQPPTQNLQVPAHSAQRFALTPRSTSNPNPYSIFMEAFFQHETPTNLPQDIMGAKV